MLSQNDLAVIFNQSKNAYLILAPDTPNFTIIDVNDAHCEITNKSKDHILNKPLFIAFPTNPKDLENVGGLSMRNSLEQIILSKKGNKMPVVRYDIQLRNEDGFEIRYWQPENYPIIDSCGNIKFIIHHTIDVTEKIQLEIKEKEISNELQLNKDHYRSLFEYNTDGVYSFDLEGNFLSANKSIADIAECSVEELMQTSFMPFIDLKDLEMTMAHFLKAGTGEPQNYITRILTAKGNSKILNVTNLPIVVDRVIVGVYGIAKDISHQVRTDQELVLSNERYRYVSKATNSAIWDWDLGKNQIFWGIGFTHLFGFKQSDHGQDETSWTNKIHPSDHDQVVASMHHIINSPRKSLWIEEYRFLKANGDYAFVSNRGFVIRDGFGKAIRMVGAMVDITEKKTIELEKGKLFQDLIVQNIHLEQFNYIVSHNLRAPVANVRGLTDLLIKKDLDQDVIDEIIKDIDTSILSIDNVIQDLNSILASKKDVNSPKDKIDFEEIVEDVKKSIQSTINTSKVSISYDFNGMPYFRSIKSYVHSIFYNLISNSIKYCRPGIDPIIDIKSTLKEGKILLEFSDNGLGFDNSKITKMFGLYKRLHTHVEGKGIGLFMVKSQVTSLNGLIDVHSELNRGSTFKITLPIN